MIFLILYNENLQDRAVLVTWSVSKKCLLDMLRCEQLSSDHQDGMRGRVECHQHSGDMKSHVSE